MYCSFQNNFTWFFPHRSFAFLLALPLSFNMHHRNAKPAVNGDPTLFCHQIATVEYAQTLQLAALNEIFLNTSKHDPKWQSCVTMVSNFETLNSNKSSSNHYKKAPQDFNVLTIYDVYPLIDHLSHPDTNHATRLCP